MHQLYQQEENILSRIISMLSMYHCLYLAQLCRLFPEVNNEQLTVLLRKLVRKGRLTLDSATGLVCYTGVKDADSATLSAVWLLLDFYPKSPTIPSAIIRLHFAFLCRMTALMLFTSPWEKNSY